MNNKKSNNFITADCRLITDLPAAAPSSFNKNVTNGINSLDSVVLNNGQQRRNNSNNNSFNNGLRNTVRKKQFQQTTTTMDSGILISSSTLSSPLLFSSPSPPISPISSCTDLIRPQRKPRKSKKSRAGTNPSRITTPLSPSAISSCSLASFTSSSSGLSSGASSMGTLNDPDNNNIHHSPISSNVVICPDNTVIKSSSSSAASSAGFGDMTSNDDEDFHERCNFYDEQILSSLDSMQFSRQWSLPNGFASEVITNNSYPQMPTKSKNAKRRGNNKFQNNSTNNYPKITNPALQQFFFEQHQFYRKIYDQQFAALSSIKQISLNDTIQKQSKLDRQFSESAAKANVYIPHQHLGLPPLPPPPETYSPWQPSPCLGMPEPIITPSPCEEAFLNHLKSHQIPKKQQQQTMKEAATIVTTQSNN
uniref:Uncharacterized protein n=1 Tax=Panagrolaimus sp. PS1159 TaxID=55785 RepID=A0AC35FLC9_9BILA